ncbi:methylated-DNA--[protein]-cysteine S-methyltransferase [Longitalea arenae]|uniref:methylated-DNA--[protein]-cysteine S-methyltransferase n=1 Tax=Longitalea arenae TaxID=2812558 RepID=UPI00196800A4|nr:methylated-DNA--[protein]-cysteine S-methyltransferase [Longitalea arenae]
MQESFTTYYQSPVGLLQIAGTPHFISEVKFIDEQHKVSPVDSGPLPAMAIQAVEQFIEYFHGQRRFFELPISQEGTPFQQKVWAELMNIPFGKTISYLELSHRLGDPKVIRAAAAANGKNNVAIIVPCHRVIGANNQLVGYAGGLPRKKWLLQFENKIAHGVQTLF